jgi:hypothetical protein
LAPHDCGREAGGLDNEALQWRTRSEEERRRDGTKRNRWFHTRLRMRRRG